MNDDVLDSIKINVETGITDDLFEDYDYYSDDVITDIKEFPEDIKIIMAIDALGWFNS